MGNMMLNGTITLSAEDIELLQENLREARELKALLSRRSLMNQAQICEFLDIGESTLRAWRNEGWLPYFDEGKIKKYDPDAVLAAYKLKFGASTHYKVIELNSQKRRVS